MSKKKSKTECPKDVQDARYLFNDEKQVASSTECTGLMPTPATSEDELESYSQIYDVPLAKAPKDQFEDIDHFPSKKKK